MPRRFAPGGEYPRNIAPLLRGGGGGRISWGGESPVTLEHEITEEPAIIKWGNDKNGVLINTNHPTLLKHMKKLSYGERTSFLYHMER